MNQIQYGIDRGRAGADDQHRIVAADLVERSRRPDIVDVTPRRLDPRRRRRLLIAGTEYDHVRLDGFALGSRQPKYRAVTFDRRHVAALLRDPAALAERCNHLTEIVAIEMTWH